jgi:hypothetical protein
VPPAHFEYFASGKRVIGDRLVWAAAAAEGAFDFPGYGRSLLCGENEHARAVPVPGFRSDTDDIPATALRPRGEWECSDQENESDGHYCDYEGKFPGHLTSSILSPAFYGLLFVMNTEGGNNE